MITFFLELKNKCVRYLSSSVIECIFRIKCRERDKLKVLIVVFLNIIILPIKYFNKIRALDRVYRNLYKKVSMLFPPSLYISPLFSAKMRGWVDFCCVSRFSEYETVEYLLKKVKPIPDVFIDIGAHIGKYSLMLGKLGIDEIYAIEAEKSNYLILLENIRLNKMSSVIRAYNLAIWKFKGATKLFLGLDTGIHSVVRDLKTGKMRKIKTTTLPEFIKDNISSFRRKRILIKMDIEGAEYEVIRNSLNFLKKNKPMLLVELWEENRFKVLKLLERIGYEVLAKLDENNYFLSSA